MKRSLLLIGAVLALVALAPDESQAQCQPSCRNSCAVLGDCSNICQPQCNAFSCTPYAPSGYRIMQPRYAQPSYSQPNYAEPRTFQEDVAAPAPAVNRVAQAKLNTINTKYTQITRKRRDTGESVRLTETAQVVEANQPITTEPVPLPQEVSPATPSPLPTQIPPQQPAYVHLTGGSWGLFGGHRYSYWGPAPEYVVPIPRYVRVRWTPHGYSYRLRF